MQPLETGNKASIISPVAPTRAETGEPGADAVWQEPAQRLLDQLLTSPKGLASAEVRSRLALYGANDAVGRQER